MAPPGGRYRPRRFVPLPVRTTGGWRLKPTVILAEGREPDDAFVEAAVEAASGFLPPADLTPHHYGVGVLLVHFGTRYDFVLTGYWTYETELRYGTFMRASSTSTRLAPLTSSELATDVWDLRLLAFERDAWCRHVLVPGGEAPTGDATPGGAASGDAAPGRAPGDDPARLEAYLAERLVGSI